jgi:hypothetical protein
MSIPLDHDFWSGALAALGERLELAALGERLSS